MSDVILSTAVTKAELPKTWVVLPIERVCLRVTSGGTPSRKEPSYYKGGTILWTKSSELKDWYVHDTSEKITQHGLDSSSAKLLPKDTVLLALYGDGRTITSLGLLAKPSTCNQACCAMICDPDKSDPHFLFYSLKYHRSELIGLASGASQRNLSGKLLKQFPIALPPLPTQRKIASILSAYDDLIENNTRRIAILEEMAQAIYREWFVNFRFPGHENVKLVDSPLGMIPEGWEVVPLPRLCHQLTDGTHDSPKACDDGFPLVTGKHLNNGVIEFERCYLISASDHAEVMRRCRPEAGDIVFSNIGTLGNTVLVDGNREFSLKNVALFKPHDRLNSHFLFLYLSRKETLESMIQRASGTSQKFLSLAFLRSEPVVYPRHSLLSQFDERVSALIACRATLHRKNRNLRTTRDLLLPKLISGQLDVEDIDIDLGTTVEVLEEETA